MAATAPWGTQTMIVDWQGIFPAATTQFTADYAVDLAATLDHLDVLLQAGARGVVMLGTVGESSALEPGEKLDLLRAAVARVRRRVPVLAGVAEGSTAAACRLAVAAEQAGADGLVVRAVPSAPLDGRETAAYFHAVARASSLPVMCDNQPSPGGAALTPALFETLADEETLVAIKESTGDGRRITALLNAFGTRFALFCGADDAALESLFLGATGWVATLVNAFPPETRRLWELAANGRFDQARELYRWLAPLLRGESDGKLVQWTKLAMVECGYGAETVRPPRLPLAAEERDRALQVLRQMLRSRPPLLWET